jgi:predicted AAA+ superfamily ATPase
MPAVVVTGARQTGKRTLAQALAPCGRRYFSLDDLDVVDQARRAPGRFLLTGSANLLLMRRVSESLAGRASYLTLWPMTRREQRGLGRCGMWEELLSTGGEGDGIRGLTDS